MPDPCWSAAAATVALPTPDPGPLAGYARRTEAATGTADRLEANLLLLDDGSGGRFIWIAIDSVAIRSELRQGLVRAVCAVTGLHPHQVICVASHTHSAPAGWVGTIHPGLPARVDPEAIRAVSTAVSAAAAQLTPTPTTLRWAEGTVTGVGGNRRQLDGPTDQSVGVLLVGDPTDPLAVVYDYECHPTVLGADNRYWSADWVGAARNRLRERFSTRLPVIFLQGCSGDQSTRFHRRGQTLDEVVRLGRRVADAILGALPGTPLAPGPVRLAHDCSVLDTRSADHRREEAGTAGPCAGNRLEVSVLEGQRARAATIRSGLPERMGLPLTLVQVAGRRWLHCSVELDSAAGQRLKAAATGLRVIGYSHDYHSYLTDPLAWDPDHYESMSSYFDPGQSAKFLDRCLAFISHGPSA